MRRLLAYTLTAAVLLFSATSGHAQQQTLIFTCDLNGMPAQMIMQREFVASSGRTYGPGPNPRITGVVPTGQYIVYTAGEVRSRTHYYSFRGENQFADFVSGSERFRVQWIEDPRRGGVWMIVNPFASRERRGQHFCKLTGRR